jgi:DNA-binding Lrp family transcriptional regulator
MNSIGQNFEFDNLDIQILRILMKGATIPYTEIANRLVVSEVPSIYG